MSHAEEDVFLYDEKPLSDQEVKEIILAIAEHLDLKIVSCIDEYGQTFRIEVRK